MNDARLDAALADEGAGRFLESLRRCLDILNAEPGHVPALTLASRLALLAGDAGNAIAYAREASRIEPSGTGAAGALDAALSVPRSPGEAAALLARALEIEPGLARHVAVPGSLPRTTRLDEAQPLLERALAFDPALGSAHAAAGNAHVRRGEFLQAIGAYQRAAFIDDLPEYALALSELLFGLNERAGSDYFRERALAKQVLYPRAGEAGDRLAVLALMTPGPWAANAPLDFVVDGSRIALSRLYLTGPSVMKIDFASYSAVVNAIGESESARSAIALACEIANAVAVINPPAHSWRTSRTSLAAALQDVPNCAAPGAVRLERSEVAAWREYPVLVRPVDTHGGRGLERVSSAGELGAYLERHSDPAYDLTPFWEYRSADGYYRKYRIAIVDGVPYPYHLAISSEWMVHYVTSSTPATAWMQSEEEGFLANPRLAFATWDETFAHIARAVGLDYFAIDCALLTDGRVVVFEADIASLIHCAEPAESYKHRYVPAIFTAFEKLLFERARR